VRKAMRIADP